MNTASPLRILIMGAGSLGSVVGGFMAQAGHRVTLAGRPVHMNAIREKGLTITGIWGDHHTTDLDVNTDLDGLNEKSFDLVVLSVKSYDTQDTIESIAPLVDENTLICSYQNGLGNAEIIAEAFGWDRCVEARVIFGAWIPEPGTVDVTVMAHKTALGVYRDTPHLERIKEIAIAMDEAGVPTEFSNNIGTVLWYKLAYNCALNPLSALLDVTYGALLDTDNTRQIMVDVIRELYAVGHAKDITLDPPDAERYIDVFMNQLVPSTGGHYASTREDIRNGKRTEIDALNGAICRFGEELGVPTPVNDLLTRLIRAKEHTYLA
ncbi:MAG: 2-dehydropantoate 2-reductase [Candidatus Hydrogenedentota bacterium]|nr:MAG: 2-dehydropantoate 2-reductase [Candidatus Hydrogenedentota bacterium]